jgi:signal transduction histidine kinase
MLITVVRNLLANAVKFTGNGGTVTLEIAESAKTRMHEGTKARMDEEKENLTLLQSYGLTVSISDTGIGMSQEQLNNLFRLESAHSRSGTAGEQGSALGLIVCKELLEKHGSTLQIESEEGKGSKFWFTLNAVQE